MNNFQVANPQDYYWTLKQLVNRRDALAKTKSMLMRQFHDQIQYSYPSYKKFFHEIECNTSLAFYEAYPSAGILEHMSVEELAEFLRIPSHNCCSTKKAEQILNKIEGIMEKMLKNTSYQLQTLPGVHTVTACALISHIGEIERFQNASKLAIYAGVAPICFSSAGKGKNVQNKNQGNREQKHMDTNHFMMKMEIGY